MTDLYEPTFYAEQDGWLAAYGDETQLFVSRSVQLPEDNQWMQPVNEHIAAHGLVLADEETVDAPDMWLCTAVVRQYVTPDELRNGLPAFGGPKPISRWRAVGARLAENATYELPA